jgi:hypothetical protein
VAQNLLKVFGLIQKRISCRAGISNIELLPKFISNVTSPDAKVLLIIICSAATYISKSVEYASEV